MLDTLRAAGVTPGRTYHFPYCTHKDMKFPYCTHQDMKFPYCTHKDMKSTVAVERFKRGPVGLLTVIPSGSPVMGKYLGQWFLYWVLIGVFVAYLTGRTLSRDTQYLDVFRVAGPTAFLGYAVPQIQDSIWKGPSWSVTSTA